MRSMLHIIYKLMVVSAVVALSACSAERHRWRIGVSQCSEDIWRDKLNRELAVGGYVNDNVTLEILSANDNDQKQIAQIRHFVKEKVDLLIVAPNSAERLTAIIDSAYECGIPVILFDRKTNSNKFTAFMGADNYKVGQTMGMLIASRMKGRGTLVEITGLRGSSPAIERHRGFAAAIARYPGIRLLSSKPGDWTERSGENAMRQLLDTYHGPIDCVFGHNDRLAMGARRAATGRGLKGIGYYGVDALPTPGGGIDHVRKGVFEASYMYPTQGIDLMRLALRILEGKPYEKFNPLYSTVVDRQNADLLMLQDKEMQRMSGDLQTVYSKLDVYFSQVDIQQKVIVGMVLVLVIIVMLGVTAYRFYLDKLRLNEEMVREILSQRPAAGTAAVSNDAPAAAGTLLTASDDGSTAGSTFLERFRTILQNNLHDADFNVERIGEEIGISRVQLYRKVKSLTGMSPVELLRKARLARGRMLVETTDRSISEIAYDTGFSAPSYFAKCFKDEFGVSPGEMRSGVAMKARGQA